MKDKDSVYNIKFLLVVLVVLGHAIQYISEIRNMNYDENFLFKFIYIFHMPAFAFVSGFIQGGIDLKKVKLYFKILIIPFAFWGVLLNYNNSILNALLEIIIRSDNSLWFLLVIFECLLINFVFIKYDSLTKFFISVFLCYLILIFICVYLKIEILGLKQLLTIFPYFMLGQFLKRFNYLNVHMIKRNKRLWYCVFIIISAIFLVLWERRFIDFNPIYNKSEIINLIQFYIMKLISPLSFIILIYLYIMTSSVKANSVTRFFSVESLAFYALQFWVISFYIKFISDVSMNIYFDILMCFIFVIFCVVLQIIILNKFENLKKVLCGK